MDFVLLAICLFAFLRGCFKGFVSTIFSFVGTFLIAIISWWLCDYIVSFLKTLFDLEEFVSELLNSKFSGTFSSMEDLQGAISGSGMLFAVLFRLLGNISFEGNLTAGQILAPSISNIVYKIIAFAILFVGFMLALSLIKFLLNKFVTLSGLGFGNRALGGVLGFFQGLLIFGVVFFVFSALANFLMNETLINFVQSGSISKLVYENVIIKSIDFFF